MNLWTVSDGILDLNLHPGQSRAWESQKRFVAILAGTQGGKTSFEPWWLYREIQDRGAGDYIAGTASYDLFKLKMLPTFRECFEHVLGIGRYWSSDRIIEIANLETGEFQAKRADDPMWARIILRSAESGGGWESATAKGAVLDEAGQDAFTLDVWQAAIRRLSLNRGRVLIGTTIYNLGWLKQQVYDKAMAGHPDYDVIQFDSTENPMFPREEYEAARENMPDWKFNMFYRGMYERPAGLIYSSFDEKKHRVPRFQIPDHWQRYLGLDFGGVNTVGIFYAMEPLTGRLYAYREYKSGERTAQEHTDKLMFGEIMVPICVGGSKSEGQWRKEFRAAGLPVREPAVSEVEVGIDRVFGASKRDELYIFDDLDGYLDQKASYSREVDDQGEPTEDIKDKSKYHYMDAERYIVGWLKPSHGRPGRTQQNYMDT